MKMKIELFLPMAQLIPFLSIKIMATVILKNFWMLHFFSTKQCLRMIQR